MLTHVCFSSKVFFVLHLKMCTSLKNICLRIYMPKSSSEKYFRSTLARNEIIFEPRGIHVVRDIYIMSKIMEQEYKNTMTYFEQVQINNISLIYWTGLNIPSHNEVSLIK